VDYKLEIVDLLKVLRGDMSQVELTTLLKLPKNTVNKWKNNKKSIKWHDFVELCHEKNLSLKSLLEEMLVCELETLEHMDILNTLIGKECLLEVSENSGIGHSTLYNWFNKDSRPTLEHVLILFDHYTAFSSSFFIEQIVSLANKEEPLEDESYLRDIIYNNPRVLLLFKLLEMPEFSPFKLDQVDELAKLASVPKFYIEEKINFLLSKGNILKDGVNYQLRRRSLPLGTNRTKFINLTNYWFKEAIRMTLNSKRKSNCAKSTSILSFAMYNFDDEALRKADELTVKYTIDLKRIATESESGENTRMVTVSFWNPLGN